ncbi:HET-domain-containing protein, partial [Apiospora saccharicola]
MQKTRRGQVISLPVPDKESSRQVFRKHYVRQAQQRGGCEGWATGYQIGRSSHGGSTTPADFIGCCSPLSSDAIVKPREINSDQIDYDLIRAWIRSCEKNHASLCSPSTNEAIGLKLKVIDCLQRRITELSEESPYVALSYVWGAAASTEVVRSDSTLLPANLPRVIEDSCLLVRNLGYRCLWADRYCVEQDNEEAKHLLINSMDLVYGNAKITIIAAAGDGPEHGLPGVGSQHRERQQCLTVGNRRFIRTFPDVAEVLRDSTWSTR